MTDKTAFDAARFEARVLGSDPAARRLLLDVLAAAVRAVDPGAAVSRSLVIEPDGFSVAGARFEQAALGRIILLALGKAAPAMAAGAHEALIDYEVTGLVVSDHEAPVAAGVEMIVGGHPVPDAGSLAAGERLLHLAESAGPRDVVLCLLSGGGSALAEVPVVGVELADIEATTSLLLLAGAPITEVNTVRKHLSAVKGGRLGAAVAGQLVTLVVSDVVGSPLDVIASGPTVPDESTYTEALAVLDRRTGRGAVPGPVLDHLAAGAAGSLGSNPAGSQARWIEIVADGPTAAAGAVAAAESMGLAVHRGPSDLEGEAAPAAVRCLEAARPGLTVIAGETTVTVLGEGRGGRNQHAALAAAIWLEGRSDLRFAAMGTDGVDGPTGAAGAIVDGETTARIRDAGIDPVAALENSDSGTALEAAGERLIMGPTGTNVGDLWLVWSDGGSV